MNFEFPKLHSHELVLFFYPSPGLNWMNPKALTFTTARNKLSGKSRGIGHVSVMIRTPEDFALTGMTQASQNEGRAEVLFRGYGLGILLHNFKGILEKAESLAPELVTRSRAEGKLSFLRVAANEKITDRLLTYLREYREKGLDHSYGMRNRPLYGEGGGCSAFGASFLETAGLLREEFTREWTRTFNIPRDLIGGPITGKKVSVLTMLRRADRWAQEDEPHEKGFFWDPDLMHAWLVRTYGKERAFPTGSFKPETWNSAVGLTVDATTAEPPTGHIFRHL
ncbi:MAG: hypothetical protein JST04_01855 [Bdellovibrionales bacterium]|nr:hypothetical protein [Bdellovibrionales bacterium]